MKRIIRCGQTYHDKLIVELVRCGWVFTDTPQPIWVSDGSFKAHDYSDKGKSSSKKEQELKKAGTEYATTHSNFTGETFWIKKDGFFVATTEPSRMTFEFAKDGSFIRGWGTSTSAYDPTMWNRHHRSTGSSFKQLLEWVLNNSPEKKAERKVANIRFAQNELDQAIITRNEYRTKIKVIRDKIALILGCTDLFVIDRILEAGLLKYPIEKTYDDREVADAQKKLEEARDS